MVKNTKAQPWFLLLLDVILIQYCTEDSKMDNTTTYYNTFIVLNFHFRKFIYQKSHYQGIILFILLFPSHVINNM